MNGIVAFVYGQTFFIGFLVFVLSLFLFKTPAKIFLLAWLRKKPVSLVFKKSGNAVFRIPKKIEHGMAVFEEGKVKYGYLLNRDAFAPLGGVQLGLLLEERGGYVPPKCFVAAKKLKEQGFENFTEAEIAFLIKELENETGQKISENLFVDVGKEKINVVDWLGEILKERGVNKYAEIRGEIRKVLKEKLQEKIENCTLDFKVLSNFFKYSMNPAAIQEKIDAEKLIARESFSVPGAFNIQTALFIFILLLAIAVFLYLLTSTGTLESITKSVGLKQVSGGIGVK